MKKWLLSPPSQKDFIHLLLAWRLWLLGVVLGALLGALAYLIFSPPYRAQAVVVVDTNMEQAWPDAKTERDLMTYLARETQKLEAAAWADTTLEAVSGQVGSVTVTELRGGILHLSQPSDGSWLFWADNPDPARAALLASAWAEAFTDQVRQGIDIALHLETLHNALAADPASPQVAVWQENIRQLESQSLGITPFIQVSLSQDGQPLASRSVSLAVYIFTGAVTVMVIAALIVLLVGPKDEDERKD